MFAGHRSAVAAERGFAARMTVRADFLFTLPAVIVQPVSGMWLIAHGGFAWNEMWLLLAYLLYALAGACWLPVVAIQMRMQRMLAAQRFDAAAPDRRSRSCARGPAGARAGGLGGSRGGARPLAWTSSISRDIWGR